MALHHRMVRREPWQRFTLLDILLLQASFGLSFSLACSVGPAGATALERAVAGTVWGAVLAGPIVLMAQWIVRNRSRGLSAGEWLWLSPTALFCLLWLSLQGPAAYHSALSRHLFSFWVFAQVTCMGVAVATLVSGLRGYRSTVPCFWTDRAGNLAGLVFGIWSFLLFLPFALAG
jgi:hypothetical protein